jgi:hypothetical protein
VLVDQAHAVQRSAPPVFAGPGDRHRGDHPRSSRHPRGPTGDRVDGRLLRGGPLRPPHPRPDHPAHRRPHLTPRTRGGTRAARQGHRAEPEGTASGQPP